MTTATTAKPAGRPRDAARDAAILDAAVEVLSEVGYDRLTIDAVAARAKASKATVYRRWANKAALVVDAVHSCKPVPVGPDGETKCYFPDTGSLRGDLLQGVRAFVDTLNSDEGKLLAGLVSAQTRDPELARAMREATFADKQRSCRIVAERALAR